MYTIARDRVLVGLMLAGSLTAAASAAEAPPAAPDGPIASPEAGWPQFRGPRRDGISDETGLLPVWPPGGPKLTWKAEGLGRGWSSPIVANGAAVITGDVASDLVIFCFDLEGKLKWKATNGKAWKGSHPGARACPVYSQGLLYHLNAHGRVAALDAASGREVWSVNILERFESEIPTWGLTECLLVDGGRLIVTPGGSKTLLVALDTRDGRTVWMSEPIPGERASYAPPILFRMGGRRLLGGCSSRHGFGVDAGTGKLLWRVPLPNPHDVNACGPAYGDGRVFYVTPDGTAGAQYRLVESADGVQADLAWRSPIDTAQGGVILKEGALYAGAFKNTQSMQRIDWATGRTRYELKLTKGKTHYASSAILWADGRIYCLSEDGLVSLLSPTAGTFDVAGHFRLVTAGPRDVWAHPVVSAGRLYLRYHETLWCYDVRIPERASVPLR
jgi:outer membrane protein assembly factor BamB